MPSAASTPQQQPLPPQSHIQHLFLNNRHQLKLHAQVLMRDAHCQLLESRQPVHANAKPQAWTAMLVLPGTAASAQFGFLPSLAQGLLDDAAAGADAVITLDFTGSGQSEGRYWFGCYESQVEDTQDLIVHLMQRQCRVLAVIGHSMGANVALQWAARHVAQMQPHPPRLVSLSSRFHMDAALPFTSAQLQQLHDTGSVQWQPPVAHTCLVTILQSGIDERRKLDTRAAALTLQRERCALLVVHGKDDRVIPYQDSIDLVAHISQAQLLLLSNCDHNYTRTDNVNEVVKAILAFVADPDALGG